MEVSQLDPAVEAEFLARVESAPRRLLLLDYDGTLAPFRVDRDTARPHPGVDARLREIAAAPRSRVVILSGRRAAEIRDLLRDGPELEIWGAHGAERFLPGRDLEMASAPAAAQRELAGTRAAILARLADRLHTLDPAEIEYRLELKPGGLAVHVRALPMIEALEFERAAREEAHAWKALPPLRMLPFDGGLELRIPGPDKGDAVHAVLEGESLGADAIAIACLGDDATDEDAFRALPAAALTLLVADTPRTTAARYRIGSGDGVLAFLSRWSTAVGGLRTRGPEAGGEP